MRLAGDIVDNDGVHLRADALVGRLAIARVLLTIVGAQVRPSAPSGPRFQPSTPQSAQSDSPWIARLASRDSPILESKAASAVQRNLSPIHTAVAQPGQLRKLVIGYPAGAGAD